MKNLNTSIINHNRNKTPCRELGSSFNKLSFISKTLIWEKYTNFIVIELYSNKKEGRRKRF